MASSDSAPRRSRLSKLVAEEQKLSALRDHVEGAIARFSTMPVSFGATSPYHAAQTTRLRQFTGEGFFANRPRHEDQMLKPFDHGTIIARARTMIRNNPWLSAIFLAYVQEIGTPTFKSTVDLGDAEKSAKYNDRRERAFARWAKDCESDADLSLDEVVEIWNYERVIAGEMYIVKLKTGELQLIAAELCGSEKAGSDHLAGATWEDGTPVEAGAKEDAGRIRLGRRIIGYRFGQRDADTGAVSFGETSTLVRRQYVQHLHDRDRVEQSKGVPPIATFLGKMQDLFETTDARSQQVKNAACLSMWITKNMDPLNFADAMRGALRSGAVQDAVALKELASQRSNYGELRAGAVYYGAAGETVNLIEPKLGAGDWIEHYIGLLQVCCANLDGMPVEVGIEGFRRSNYSGSRATMNKWQRNVRRRRARIEAKLLDATVVWQTRRMQLFGELDPIPESQIEEIAWGWPPIPEIDGTKTAAQNAVELANGSTTLRRIYADKGLHHDVEMKQLATEKIDAVLEFARQAETRLKLSSDAALKWAMAAAPGNANPALSAVLADAFQPEAPAAPVAKT